MSDRHYCPSFPPFFRNFNTTRQRRDVIRELCIQADRNGHLSILFSSPSLHNCRFRLHVILWFACSITCKFLRRLTNELHTFYHIYRSLWAEYLTLFFPYQILSPKNVLLSSTFWFCDLHTASRTRSRKSYNNDGANRKIEGYPHGKRSEMN